MSGMQPGEGRSGNTPADQELAERLRQANISGAWPTGAAFPGQLAAAYAVPYGVAAPFQQAQPGFALTPQGQMAGTALQYAQAAGAQRPASGSRPASASGQRAALQNQPAGIRPPQYAAFYPQLPAGYPMQYMPPAQFRALPGQQMQPFPPQYLPPQTGARAPFQFPGAQFPGAGNFQPPRQGRAGGRQPPRGRAQRGPQDPNRGRGQGQYRAMWQQVTQVTSLSH